MITLLVAPLVAPLVALYLSAQEPAPVTAEDSAAILAKIRAERVVKNAPTMRTASPEQVRAERDKLIEDPLDTELALSEARASYKNSIAMAERSYREALMSWAMAHAPSGRDEAQERKLGPDPRDSERRAAAVTHDFIRVSADLGKWPARFDIISRGRSPRDPPPDYVAKVELEQLIGHFLQLRAEYSSLPK